MTGDVYRERSLGRMMDYEDAYDHETLAGVEAVTAEEIIGD